MARAARWASCKWACISALCTTVLCSPCPAATVPGPHLVKDIATVGKSSLPSDLVEAGGRLFFVADDGLHGAEVWRSDGTAGGTSLVRDIRPGPATSGPYFLTSVGETLYFAVSRGLNGVELWRTDGSEAGTVRVAVLESQAVGYPSPSVQFAAAGDTLVYRDGGRVWGTDGTEAGTVLLVDFGDLSDTNDAFEAFSAGDRVFFSAHDQLWVTDGTPAGTWMLSSSLALGFDIDGRQSFTVLDDGIIFVADDGVHGRELWSSDGTPAGTALFQDVTPGPDGFGAMFITPLDGALIFGARGPQPGLWRTDGTAVGTTRLAPAVPIRPPVRFGDAIFFIALGDAGTYDLWRTDGTAAGTARLSFSSFGRIAALDDGVYFFTAVANACLLVRATDTSVASFVVLRIDGSRPSPAGTCVQDDLTRIGGQLFFAADDVHGTELWRSDGTAAGTRMVRDIRPSTITAAPRDLVDAGGRLLFLAADDGLYGPELWVSDGTESGTRLFVERPSSLAWAIFGPLGNRLLFQQSPTMPRLWATDGTAAGTMPLTSFELFSPPTIAGSLAFFPGPGTADGQSLWRTDGTPAGTMVLRQVRPTTSPVSLEGRLLFFAGDDAHGSELWSSDGSADGTLLVKDINPGPASSFVSSPLTVWRNRAYFAAADGTHGAELWSSDGTAAGTHLVRDIDPGAAGSGVDVLAPTASGLFFIADDGHSGREPWMTDGTEAGTRSLGDIDPGPEGSEPREITAINGVVVFAAFDPDVGVELWRSDGTSAGTVLLKDIKPGTGSSYPMRLRAVGDYVYFAAHDGRHGWEAWRTDGSRAGTQLVDDVDAGGASAFFTTRVDDYHPRAPLPSFTDVDGAAIFVADDGGHGRELWAADPRTATLLADIAPGSSSSDPLEPTVSGRQLFFTAENEATGRELWAVNRAEVGAACVGDCDSLWEVDVTNLITGVRIALGALPLTGCPAFDADGDGTATVDELILAIGNALDGCRSLAQLQPPPLPIESASPLPSRPARPARTPGPTAACRRTGCSGEICADHDVDFGTLPCFIKPEDTCLGSAPCEMVGDQCAFVITPGSLANRCLAALGDCVTAEDCNLDEICEPAADDRPALAQPPETPGIEPFGSCAPRTDALSRRR